MCRLLSLMLATMLAVGCASAADVQKLKVQHAEDVGRLQAELNTMRVELASVKRDLAEVNDQVAGIKDVFEEAQRHQLLEAILDVIPGLKGLKGLIKFLSPSQRR